MKKKIDIEISSNEERDELIKELQGMKFEKQLPKTYEELHKIGVIV